MKKRNLIWAAPILAAVATPSMARQDAAGLPQLTAAGPNAWWTLFGDPELDALTRRGAVNNADIAAAIARVSLARAALRGADADRLPRVTAIADVAGQSGALINAAGDTGTLYELGARASYELDLFGRLSKSRQAARLDVEAASAELGAARLLVEADIAQTYFAARALEQEQALVAGATVDANQAVAIAESRLASGTGTELDLNRARAELGILQADLQALERKETAARNALALLTGEKVAPALSGSFAPTLPVIPAGMSSELLMRRPDVSASLSTVKANRLRVRAAKAAWFPAISLTGDAGQASPALGDLLRATAQSFGFNLLMSLPIFDGGRHAASVRRAEAELELSEAKHRGVILGAFRDVSDQLSGLRTLEAEEASIARAVAADREALGLAEQRFRNGSISRLELLDIRRQSLANARRWTQTHFARFVATVGLIKALGGGWSGAAAVPVMREAN